MDNFYTGVWGKVMQRQFDLLSICQQTTVKMATRPNIEIDEVLELIMQEGSDDERYLCYVEDENPILVAKLEVGEDVDLDISALNPDET